MKNRRSFLKNTAIGAVTLGLSSNISAEIAKEEGSDIICDPTTLDYYGPGPFYSENPPMIEGSKLVSDDQPGTRMIISGRVLNLDCNQFIPKTIVDVWHADEAGEYDNIGFDFRGYTETNDQGFYLFETIIPGKYLNGNSFRPAHIHYKITPPGFATLTTQLYFEGDDSISGDAAASIQSGTYDATNRIIALTENAVGVLEGTFDIVINGEGVSVGTTDLHLDKGMIYKVSPNPFENRLEIEYGVFKKARVGLVVYDLAGKQVAILEDKTLRSDKYISIWEPPTNLASGHYFLSLKVNDLQVHYLKIFKQ